MNYANILTLNICKVQGLNPYAKYIYIILASYVDGEGKCYPSLETIAKNSGLSVKTVWRSINYLDENNFINKVSGSKGISNKYIVHCPLEKEMNEKDMDSQSNKVVLSIDNFSKDNNSTYLDSQSTSFDFFWSIYPRKIAKANARKAFQTALTKTEAYRINEGLIRMVEANKNTEMKFIPHPATWLNGERWEDEDLNDYKTNADVLNNIINFQPPTRAIEQE
tara:strand:- start:38 stop:703 length:666 start_codon:yes stop_codon:yes gene_type:complete